MQEFLKIVRKYTDPSELTPEMLRELVEKVIIHAPDKSSGLTYITILLEKLTSPQSAARLAGEHSHEKRKKPKYIQWLNVYHVEVICADGTTVQNFSELLDKWPISRRTF